MGSNEILQKLFDLLGKSEKNTDLIELFKQLNIDQPLPHAYKDTGSTLLEDSIDGMHIGFTNSEDLPQYEEDNPFMEGELIFTDIYVRSPKLFENNVLPLGLKSSNTLQETKKTFGEPEWTRSYGQAYRWSINHLKLMLTFDENNENLIKISYMIPQSFHF